jgi:nitrous oxidase accessory protein
MSLSQINKKLILVLFLVFATSALYIFYSENNEKHSDNFLGNINNNSIKINVHPGDSIQQAINNTNSGGTVTVYPGSYKENLVVDKSIVITSNEGESADTIIQASDPERDIFYVTADNVTISGFNITGAKSKAGIRYIGFNGNITGNKLVYNKYGISLKNSRNILIKNNTALRNGYGFYFSNSSRNVLENNEVNNSSIGVYLENSTDNELNFNIASSNYDYAIYLKNSHNNWLKTNNIFGIWLWIQRKGIYLEDSDNNKIIYNNISNTWDSINLTNSSDNELNKNKVSLNYFSISLDNSNNNKLLNNTIDSNGYTYSISLGNSQNNILKGNTAGPNTEIKVIYDALNSTNNTLEGGIRNADEPRKSTIKVKNIKSG